MFTFLFRIVIMVVQRKKNVDVQEVGSRGTVWGEGGEELHKTRSRHRGLGCVWGGGEGGSVNLVDNV